MPEGQEGIPTVSMTVKEAEAAREEAAKRESVPPKQVINIQDPRFLRPHIMPILLEMSALANKSNRLRDWRECRDPIWNRPYFVNLWTSDVCYDISESMNLPYIRWWITFYSHNIEPRYLESNYKDSKEVVVKRVTRVIIKILQIPSSQEHLIQTDWVVELNPLNPTEQRVRFDVKIDCGSVNTLYPKRQAEIQYLLQEDNPQIRGILSSVLAGLPEILSFRYDESQAVRIESLSGRCEEVLRGVLKEEQEEAAWRKEHARRLALGGDKEEGEAGAPGEDGSTTAAGGPGTATEAATSPSGSPTSRGAKKRGGKEEQKVHEAYPGQHDEILLEIRNSLKFRKARSLDFSRKPVGSEGALHFFTGFREFDGGSKLLQLHLWGCQLGDQGCDWLFREWPASVRNLWLDDNDISVIRDEVLPMPEKNNLEEVYLAGNRLGSSDTILSMIQRFRCLINLDLASNGIGARKGESILTEILTQGQSPEGLVLAGVSLQSNRFTGKIISNFLLEWNECKTVTPESAMAGLGAGQASTGAKKFALQFLDLRYMDGMSEAARAVINGQFKQDCPSLKGSVLKILSDEGIHEEHGGDDDA